MAEPGVDIRSDPRTRSARHLVIVVALAVLAVKLAIAATTLGTNDAFSWTTFADAVRHVGPVGIYSVAFPIDLYNHPPLVGYYLWVLNQVAFFGPSIRFLVRASASMADVITAVLVFEILRRRRPLAQAATAGLLVATSPVLLIISGFHANTDPIFTMFVIAAVYLLSDRDLPGLAGAALALAIGFKVVPVVVLPAFFVCTIALGWRKTVQLSAGFAVVFVISWTPALLLQFREVVGNVLGYPGIPVRQWGLIQLAHWAGDSPAILDLLTGPLRFASVAVAALVPAWLVWRRPDCLPAAIGISLGLFLILSPAFGHQYLVWPAAALYFVTISGAALYNLVAGALIVVVYSRWAGTWPWYEALGSPMTAPEVALAYMVWLILVAVVAFGFYRELREPRARTRPLGLIQLGTQRSPVSRWAPRQPDRPTRTARIPRFPAR